MESIGVHLSTEAFPDHSVYSVLRDLHPLWHCTAIIFSDCQHQHTHHYLLPSPCHPHIECKLPAGRFCICVERCVLFCFPPTAVSLLSRPFTWNWYNHKILEGTYKTIIIQHLHFCRWGNPERLSDCSKATQLVGAKPQSKLWIFWIPIK